MATAELPSYLHVPPDRLGQGTPVRVRIRGDIADIAADMAQAILHVIQDNHATGRPATLILPVGPVDQFPILAKLINEQRTDCRDVLVINMDEYLTEADRWVELDHPLSFRGFMNRKFYDLLDPTLAPRPENRVFPDPQKPDAIARLIEQRGGVDACFGGIGINGHIAFNEPPEPGESVHTEAFAALPTRCLSLARETRTINSVTVGGEITIIPRRAVTVGMREILASRPTAILLQSALAVCGGSASTARTDHPGVSSVVPTNPRRCRADRRQVRGRASGHSASLEALCDWILPRNESWLSSLIRTMRSCSAGTLARAKTNGAAIGICVLCQGDKGQPTPPIENLASVRRAEMTAAAALLGADLLLGEFPDATLRDGPDERQRLIELFATFGRPWCWLIPPTTITRIIAPSRP